MNRKLGIEKQGSKIRNIGKLGIKKLGIGKQEQKIWNTGIEKLGIENLNRKLGIEKEAKLRIGKLGIGNKKLEVEKTLNFLLTLIFLPYFTIF